jgi:hypothetical protein
MNRRDSSHERKERSEQLLKALNVPVNPSLPRVESEAEARHRQATDVAKRALALHAVISAAHDEDRESLVAWLKDEVLWESVSPKEKEFLQIKSPARQEVIMATWRVESLWVLLWALGKVEKLILPREICDMELLQEIMSAAVTTPLEFATDATLRSSSEILDAMDLIYRIDWAVVDARLLDHDVPGGFDPGVVYERHYALNWLTCYSEDWDDVTTDT